MSLHLLFWYLLTPFSLLHQLLLQRLLTQSSGPAESLVRSEETTENMDSNPDDPEPAADGDTKVKYSSD